MNKLSIIISFVILTTSISFESFGKNLSNTNKEQILKILFNKNNEVKNNEIVHQINNDILKKFDIDTEEKNFYTKIIYSKEIKPFEYIIITSTKGDSWECHACSPIIGVLEVKEKNKNFYITTPFSYVDKIGTWGEAPNPEIIKIGKNNFGILFNSAYTGMGMTVEAQTIIAKVNNKFKNIINLNDTYQDNFGACGDDLPSPCYKYQSKIVFPNLKNKLFSDIIVTKEGTTIDQNNKIKKFKEVKKYIFHVDKYK